jgi:capsular exopolysaccharide synthesis family protein
MNASTPNGLPLNPDGFPNGSPGSRNGIRWNEFAAFDFPRWKRLLGRHAWLIFIIIAAALAGMWVYVRFQPPIYASRAAIQLEQQQPKVLNKIEAINEAKLDAEDYVKTVVELLSSDSLMLRVVKANGLDRDPAFVRPKPFGVPYLDSELAAKMQRKVTISQRHGSRIVDVVVEDRDPRQAALLANSIVNEFLREAFQQNVSASTSANEFLLDQAESLKKKLQISEQKLQQYREQNQAVSLDEKQNITVEKLKDINAKVTAARSERMRLEADLNQVRHSNGSDIGRLLEIGSVASLPQVSEIRVQLIKAKEDFAAVTKRYLSGHPKYVAATAEVNDLERSLADAVRKAREVLTQQYQAAVDLENKLNDALKEQEDKALELNRISIPYNVLAREAESDRVLYDNVITRLKETGVTKGADLAPYRIAETAMVSASPVRPRRAMLMLVALLGGTALGIGVVVTRNLLDTTVHTVDDAEKCFGLEILAAVPEQKGSSKGIGFLKNPASAQAEAVRALRASLLRTGKGDEAHRSYVIASALPLEGKTTICLNLAAAFARQGLRTLVIDADLRRPQISELLTGVSRAKVCGLSDYLCRQAGLEQVIHPLAADGVVNNLCVLPAGQPVGDPAELLALPAFPELLAKLRQKFDRIVIDSAPVTAVSDTLAFAAASGGVCFVIRAGKTPSETVQAALDQLAKAGATIIGAVINRMALSDVPYYAAHPYRDEHRGKPAVFSSSPKP